jgi:two-component system, NtrC family, response regulator AtoC
MQSISNGRTILVAEDELDVRSYLEMALRCQGYGVELVQDGDEVISHLETSQNRPSLLLLDIMMPRKDGMETLRQIRTFDTQLPIIMLSAAASPVNVVDAMKGGANNFLPKPITHEELREAIERALEADCGRRTNSSYRLQTRLKQTSLPGCMPVGEIESALDRIGSSEVPVLILGETGVGKEVLARRLHAQSPRADGPFVKLNCAALPSELVESELFGYERGAFTGAFQRKPGMFEMADGGTLLLDEIGDMDYKLQAKLLQVVQDQEFHRIGGKDTIRVDVRLIAATHCDLEKAIAEKTFREDLYYRLNVVSVRIPALRARKPEIVPLAEFFLEKHAGGGAVPVIPPGLRQAMLAYEWPGNIRELENIMRKFLVMGQPEGLAEELRIRRSGKNTVALASPALPAVEREETSELASPILKKVNEAKEQAETEVILSALNSTFWNRKQAAALLNIDYKALLYKMKKLAIESKVGAPPSAKAGSLQDIKGDPGGHEEEDRNALRYQKVHSGATV